MDSLKEYIDSQLKNSKEAPRDPKPTEAPSPPKEVIPEEEVGAKLCVFLIALKIIFTDGLGAIPPPPKALAVINITIS